MQKKKLDWEAVRFVLKKMAFASVVATAVILFLQWATGSSVTGLFVFVALMWGDAVLMRWRFNTLEAKVNEMYKATGKERAVNTIFEGFTEKMSKPREGNDELDKAVFPE